MWLCCSGARSGQVFSQVWHVISVTLNISLGIWTHKTEVVFVSPFFSPSLKTHCSNSKAHPCGADIIFPLFHCFFFLPPSSKPLWVWKLQRREGGLHPKGRERGWFACQHLYPDREAGRQRGLGGEGSILVQLFKDLLTGFLLCRPRNPWNRQHTFLPLIAADETLMCLCLPSTWHMHSPQIQATAMLCGQVQLAKLRQGSDQIQTDSVLTWQ